MNLIKLYIDEVIRRLPDDAREDIALELDSIIHDMLPENYSEKDVKKVLRTLGHPAVLASKYSDRPMHLIGPKYYDLYMSLLKMIVPIAVIVALIATISEVFFTTIQPGETLNIIIILFSHAIWTVINVFIQTFFWLTLIFAIIEYSDKAKEGTPISMRFKPWTPEDLTYMKHIPKQKMIKKFEMFLSLLWTATWVTVYFYADHLLGIYQEGAEGLRMVTPSFNQEVLTSFWPIVVIIVAAEIVLTVYKMIEKQWTKRLATFFTIKEIVTGLLFIIILLQPNLFTVEFLQGLSELFDHAPLTIQNRIVWGAIGLMIIFSGIAIFDAFRKANMKASKK